MFLSDGLLICENCLVGYEGRYCEKCKDGYFGWLRVSYIIYCVCGSGFKWLVDEIVFFVVFELCFILCYF